MRRAVEFAIGICAALLIGGCAAGKPAPPAPVPLPDNTPMIAAMQKDHQETLRLAMRINKDAALTVPMASVPPTPAGFFSPWGNLHTLTIIASNCPAGEERCASPSLPAAAAGQRAETEGVADRQARNEAGGSDRAGGSVVTGPEESTHADPPARNLIMLNPVK